MILIILIKGQDDYEKLINEKVSEDYCTEVITNFTSIIDKTYIYSDFIKAPKQPVGYENYIPKVDLIKELNSINKINRTFYDFYRDILNILRKTRDGHFYFSAYVTPQNFNLDNYYFCIPFKYKIIEILNDEKKVEDTFLSIESITKCQKGYSDKLINKIKDLNGKKIITINNISPYEYLEEMGKKYFVLHSPQARYITISSFIHNLYIDFFPFKKDELNISIEFEKNESLHLEYQFEELEYYNEEFKEEFLEEKRKRYKGFFPILDFEQYELKYKIKRGIISKNNKRYLNLDWDIISEDKTIKCKIDNKNKYNVMYQNSFNPDDDNFNNYEDTMKECFLEFYSNDYKIIIIEDKNGGGYLDLCVPFTEYLRPKITKPYYNAMKQSDINLELFTNYYQYLNPETCLPYTDKDNFFEGIEDKYSEQVIHKKTKLYDSLDIIMKKNVEKNKKDYLSTGKTKKPTEIMIFTDGFSFSCTSTLITGLQMFGAAILVGYNSRPDLKKEEFDASQSNSGTNGYEYTELANNLYDLGYELGITMEEEFDINDKNNPKTPFEFLVNPVDEIVKIYKAYNDEIYDRFINEANIIFEKYNDLENGECNIDNKYLFYETKDCDSKLNIEKAHGGYLCGVDGKWNKSNCIAAYCDNGYILNDERTECIKDLCQEINSVDIIINNIEKSKEYIIEPKTVYSFFIDDVNNSYNLLSKQEDFMIYYDDTYIKKFINNQTSLISNYSIYINYYLNISEKTKLIVVNSNYNYTNYNSSDKDNKNKRITMIILLIGIWLLILLYFLNK